MTPVEYRLEHRHIYDTRLGIREVYGVPSAEQHNEAVAEADAHIDALKQTERADSLQALLDIRDSL